VGGRSRAAAQLLAGKGFKEVINLKGGIVHWEGLEAEGPADMGMPLVRGDETPQETIALAYGMEKGLGELYRAMAEISGDSDVTKLLTRLADIEDRHKEKLFDLYLTMAPDVSNREAFEDNLLSGVMEGGFTTEEFLEENKGAMNTASGVLNISMMLETQALDLYLRYAQKAEEEKSKGVLYKIADEEKAHLKSLGRLMDEYGIAQK
jgi:rubrerythrin